MLFYFVSIAFFFFPHLADAVKFRPETILFITACSLFLAIAMKSVEEKRKVALDLVKL